MTQGVTVIVATTFEYILHSDDFFRSLYIQSRQLKIRIYFQCCHRIWGMILLLTRLAMQKRVRESFLKEQVESNIFFTVKPFHILPGRIHLFCLSIPIELHLYLSCYIMLYLIMLYLIYHGSYLLQVFNKCCLNAHIMNFSNRT